MTESPTRPVSSLLVVARFLAVGFALSVLCFLVYRAQVEADNPPPPADQQEPPSDTESPDAGVMSPHENPSAAGTDSPDVFLHGTKSAPLSSDLLGLPQPGPVPPTPTEHFLPSSKAGPVPRSVFEALKKDVKKVPAVEKTPEPHHYFPSSKSLVIPEPTKPKPKEKQDRE